MSLWGRDSEQNSHFVIKKIRYVRDSILFDLGLRKPPLEEGKKAIWRALYLECFENNYSKSQKIYRYYVRQFVELYRQDAAQAEAKFKTLVGVESNNEYWSNDSYNYIADAIASLINYHVQNESYQLLQTLAKLGHGIALLRLNTRKDPIHVNTRVC